jgi:macrolide-specific efflux system membrane fusion protein
MKKKWIIAGIALLAVSLGSVPAYRKYADATAKVPQYRTETAKRRDIASSVQATGVIKAKVGAEVKVGARISGRVERLYANIGDVVTKGQLIAQLEQEDLKAKANEARMNLRIVEANLELARKNLQRMQNLYAKDYVARDKVDVAERDLKAAEAQADQVRETIRYHETQSSYANIYAPIAGVIASVATQQGETVSASSLSVPTFVTIVDLGRLEIYAYVDETDIGKIRPGLEVQFAVDSFPEKVFTGTVSAIYPKATIQDNVVYYVTVVAIENPAAAPGAPPLLKPDMTVNATIALSRREQTLSVPTRAIRREGGKKVVQVLENGKPAARTIQTGAKDSAYTEVVGGLREGDLVVTAEVSEAQKN